MSSILPAAYIYFHPQNQHLRFDVGEPRWDGQSLYALVRGLLIAQRSKLHWRKLQACCGEAVNNDSIMLDHCHEKQRR